MSLLGAAIIPAAPVLIPKLSGTARPAEEPRAAVMHALQWIRSLEPSTLVVIAEGDANRILPGDHPLALERFTGRAVTGLTIRDSHQGRPPQPEPLPLPLAVAAALLQDAGWRGPTVYRSVDRSSSAAQARAIGREIAAPAVGDTGDVPMVVLLAGSGSACTTPQAPGAHRPDADAFNAMLHSMIEHGDITSMAEITARQSAEQLSDIRIPVQVLAGLVPPLNPAGRILHAEEFRGVFYLCAAFDTMTGEHGRSPRSEGTPGGTRHA